MFVQDVRYIKQIFRVMIMCAIFGIGSWYLVQQSKGSSMEWQRISQGLINNAQEVIDIFPQSRSTILAYEQAVCDQAKKDIDAFLRLDPRDYSCATVMRYFDEISQKFSSMSSMIQIIEMVHPEQDVREAAHEVSIRLQSFAIEHFSTKKIYNIFKTYATTVAPAESLTDEEQYMLAETMRDFELAGMGLDDAKFAQFQELQKKNATTGLQFETNINTDISSMTVPRTALAGCDDAFVDAQKQDEQGNIILHADTPTAMELLAFCTVTQTRKDFWKMYNARAYPANMPVLKDLMQTRQELAAMLGFANYAERNLVNKMAKTPARVREFIAKVAPRARKKCAVEFDAWKAAMPEGFELSPDGKVYPWDVNFMKKNYERVAFSYDERSVAPYFSLDNTIDGIFKIYQEFLGLRFEVSKPKGTWHQDVQLITVYDANGSEPRGYIFLDLYPRANKYSHACNAGVTHTISFVDDSGVAHTTKSMSVVIANFPKPTADRPSLLKHGDVVTFFHEFGHAMHHLLGRTTLFQSSGTNVKWDFVEMPSQMFEEWMWQPKMLKMISKHYQTGEPLPDELIDKMVNKKIYDAGFAFSRQLTFADMSLTLHESAEHDFEALQEQLSKRYLPEVYYSSDNHWCAAFGHLNGYVAGYYGYMWSLVFACDLFGYLKKQGLGADVGVRFAHEVLGKGGSVAPDIILRNFLGREPQGDAFFKAYGLV